MAFPFDQLLIPPRLALRALDDLHSIARAAASVGNAADELRSNRELSARLDGLVASVEQIGPEVEALRKEMGYLPERVEGLRDAFEGSNREVNRVHSAIEPMNEKLQSLTSELTRVRGSIAPLGGEIREAIQPLGGEIREAIEPLEEELSEVRDVVEPLQPAAERVGRLAERMPGPGRRR